MKVLSLWQPWASLMADGLKTIETRSWRAPTWLIGKEYAIHATKKVDREACNIFGYEAAVIPRGCIVSIHRLEKCIQFTAVNIEEIADSYGDFYPGRWGWFSPLVFKLPEPIPIRGAQGLWEWPDIDLEAHERDLERQSGCGDV